MAADVHGRVRPIGGDPDWLEAYAELGPLHVHKSSTYGTPDDALANFTVVNAELPESYVIDRTIEKLTRARNMIAAGDADLIGEYMDCASLMLCAEALRRRRLI